MSVDLSDVLYITQAANGWFKFLRPTQAWEPASDEEVDAWYEQKDERETAAREKVRASHQVFIDHELPSDRMRFAPVRCLKCGKVFPWFVPNEEYGGTEQVCGYNLYHGTAFEKCT